MYGKFCNYFANDINRNAVSFAFNQMAHNSSLLVTRTKMLIVQVPSAKIQLYFFAGSNLLTCRLTCGYCCNHKWFNWNLVKWEYLQSGAVTNEHLVFNNNLLFYIWILNDSKFLQINSKRIQNLRAFVWIF